MNTTNCFKKMSITPNYISFDTVNPLKVAISGTVKNEFGDALKGANVYLQSNPTIGSATDNQGNFVIEDVPNGALIVVSFLGYKTVIFDVNTSVTNFYPIVMELEIEQLDEAIVNAVKKPKNWLWAIAAVVGIAVVASSSDEEKPKKGLSVPANNPKNKPTKVNI